MDDQAKDLKPEIDISLITSPYRTRLSQTRKEKSYERELENARKIENKI